MEIIYLIILALAIPNALILYKLCNDEVKDWSKRFKIFSAISIILAILSYFSNLEYKTPIIVGLLFITITLDTLIIKSRRQK